MSYRISINWGKRVDRLVVDQQTLDNMLANWHNDKPRGKGYCRIKIVEVIG